MERPALGLSPGGVRVPDSTLCRAGLDLLEAASPAFLRNHCLRTYVFGALALQSLNRGGFDEEAAFCAAALHDLGLIDAHMSPDQRFEIDSADAAARFCRAHAVTPERAERIWDAVALHSTTGIALHKSPEVALVHLGAGIDVAGRGLDAVPRAVIADVLDAYPRLGFKAAFHEALLAYCHKKPAAQLFTWTDTIARAGGCTLHGHPLPTMGEAIVAAPFAEWLN